VSRLDVFQLLRKVQEKLQSDSTDSGKSILLFGNQNSWKTAVTLSVTNPLLNINVYTKDGVNGTLFYTSDALEEYPTIIESLIPKVSKDDKFNFSIFEFPDFNERNEDFKLGIIFGARKILETQRNVRIVFAITEDTFEGNDVAKFMNVVSDVAGLLKNPKKFENSIGLIVTRIIPKEEKNRKIRSDDQVLKKARNFMKRVIDFQENNLQKKKGSDKVSLTKSLQLIRILNHANTGFLRIPYVCGTFDQSEFSTKSQNSMSKVIFQSLKSTKVSEDSFTTPILPKSVLQKLKKLKTQIENNIKNSVQHTTNTIKEAIINAKHKVETLPERQRRINAEHREFSKMCDIVKTLKSPIEIAEAIDSYCRRTGIKKALGAKLKKDMNYFISNLELFDTYFPTEESSSRKKSRSLATMSSPSSYFNDVSNAEIIGIVVETEKELADRKLYNTILQPLRSTMFSWEFQQNINEGSQEPSDLQEIKDALPNGKGDFILPTVIEIYNNQKDLIKEEVNLTSYIVKEAYQQPKLSCGDPEKATTKQNKTGMKLVVQGTFVKFSDFADEEKVNKRDSCDYKRLSQIIVIGTRKIFVNKDLEPYKDKEFQAEVALVTPVLEVTSNYRIDLKGLNGEPGTPGTNARKLVSNYGSSQKRLKKTHNVYPRNALQKKSGRGIPIWESTNNSVIDEMKWQRDKKCEDIKTEDAKKNENKDGSKGIPGEPGRPGGKLFILAQNILKGENLEIDVSGGDGGNGGNGGNGKNGKDGAKFPKNLLHKYVTYEGDAHGPCRLDCPWNEKRQDTACSKKYKWATTTVFEGCYNSPVHLKLYCHVTGCPPLEAGKGGNGGGAGAGGIAGDFILIGSNLNLEVENTSKSGSPGNGGTGGKLGSYVNSSYYYASPQGTKYGELIGACVGYWYLEDPEYRIKYFKPVEGKAKSGTAGGNTEGQSPPQTGEYTLTAELVYIMFREYFDFEFALISPDNTFTTFMDPLVLSSTPIAFSRELLSLEKTYLRMKALGKT